MTARGEIRPELLPAPVAQVLADTFDVIERDAVLVATAAKYDAEALRAAGEAGERQSSRHPRLF